MTGVDAIEVGGNLAVSVTETTDSIAPFTFVQSFASSNTNWEATGFGSLTVGGDWLVGVGQAQNRSNALASLGLVQLSGQDTGDISIGGGFIAGKALYETNSDADGTGAVFLQHFNSIMIQGPTQIGAAEQLVVENDAQRAEGEAHGFVVITDIATVTLGQGLEIATASVGTNDRVNNGINGVRGHLGIERVGMLNVNGDVDVSRIVVNPAGVSNGVETFGRLILSESDVHITGDVRIATSDASHLNNLIHPEGIVNLFEVDAQIDGEIVVGQATGTGDVLAFDASLTVTDSTVHASRLTVAQAALSDQSIGQVTVTRSLIDLGNVLTLGGASDLTFDLDGTTRGDEYGAIDVGLFALLNGELTVNFNFLPDLQDTFDLIVGPGSNGVLGRSMRSTSWGYPTTFLRPRASKTARCSGCVWFPNQA